MNFKLEKIVPWGRSFDEYKKMFSLKNNITDIKILSVADGPASFNCELTSKGGSVVSTDPLYQFSTEEIESRIDACYKAVLEETEKYKNNFVWNNIKSTEDLGKIRMRTMHSFLTDFKNTKNQSRYIAAELPYLPFKKNKFNLCLCSHFLFLYSQHLSLEFHKKAIFEMLRVSKEVRIFPILDLTGNNSKYLSSIIDHMNNVGHKTSIKKVNYEFQRGGNKMLLIKTKKS